MAMQKASAGRRAPVGLDADCGAGGLAGEPVDAASHAAESAGIASLAAESGGVGQTVLADARACGPAREHDGLASDSKRSCCACRHKETERSAAFQADVQKRLNRVIGQLNGVKAMIDDNRYCGDVLMQLAAAESAIHRTAEMILQDHMETCVVEQVRAGNVEVVDEAMGLIRKFM